MNHRAAMRKCLQLEVSKDVISARAVTVWTLVGKVSSAITVASSTHRTLASSVQGLWRPSRSLPCFAPYHRDGWIAKSFRGNASQSRSNAVKRLVLPDESSERGGCAEAVLRTNANATITWVPACMQIGHRSTVMQGQVAGASVGVLADSRADKSLLSDHVWRALGSPALGVSTKKVEGVG